ncbi:hypothetical protein [Alicyclobacillus fastidiosus]|uniref:O-antigen ligase domain-containing protein n=1 Tax=Alicyclobacillus fastidiosus TaxID=392011 RepID=A0ABV5ABM2_9BACL|nr:hypothetical protein [Alicyclobacillus fastidiosus]WEH07626.1 hypothetical protein PYS47_12680 [Alicyclobacillus fastidiosus]
MVERFWSIPLVRVLIGGVFATVGAYGIGHEILDPSRIKLLIFVGLILLLIGLGTGNPALSMYLLTLYLPMMAFLRRALIPLAGWGALDPLVIVAPGVILFLGSFWFYKRFVMREPITDDTRIFRLVRWMILIDFLQAANPKQGGLSVGLGGVIFYVVPLFWLILGRQYVNDRWLRRIMGTVFTMGVLVSLYGLKQTFYGFFPFEQQWVDIVNITSLDVNGLIRAFSTFSSGQEYSQYLAIGIAIGWLYVLKGRISMKIIGLVGTGVMGYAIVMASARGAIVTAATAIVIMTIMHAETVRGRVVMGFILGAVLTFVYMKIAHMHTSNPLVTHVVSGLANPLNSKDSSLAGHSGSLFSGILDGFKMPIGHGLGSTTTAGSKFGSSNGGTEVDVSNMFVSDGAVGGVIYVILLIYVVIEAFRQAHLRKPLALGVLGIFVANAGQWVNGELYSTASLVWLFVSYLERQAPRIPHISHREVFVKSPTLVPSSTNTTKIQKR